MISPTTYKIAILVLLAVIPTSTVATYYYDQQQTNKLNNRVDNSNSTLTGEITILNTDMANMNSQISSLNTLIGNVNGTLKAQLDSLQTQVNSLNAQVATLNSAVSTLQSNFSSLQSQASTLMSQVTALQTQVNQILSQLAALFQNRFQVVTGPVTIFLDFESFNFTQGSQTTSQGAWVLPTGTNVVFWLKMTNTATDSAVTVQVYTSLIFTPYSSSGLGPSIPFYVVDSATVNPTNIVSYNQATNPYVLPTAPLSGSSSMAIVKFGASAQSGSARQAFPATAGTFLVTVAFFYVYRGQSQGETVSFSTARTCTSFPAC